MPEKRRQGRLKAHNLPYYWPGSHDDFVAQAGQIRSTYGLHQWLSTAVGMIDFGRCMVKREVMLRHT